MKNYELNNQANQLRANAEATKKTFMDFYNDVKEGKIVAITDDADNVIGFNVVKPVASSMKVCKMVNGVLTVGDTEEDRINDEVTYRKFMEEYDGCDLQSWFLAANLFIKAGIVVDDVVDVRGDIMAINVEAKKVIDLDGNTVVDLSEDKDLIGASSNIIIKLLKAAVNAEF